MLARTFALTMIVSVVLVGLGAVVPSLDVTGEASADHPRECPIGPGTGRPCVPCNNSATYAIVCHPL